MSNPGRPFRTSFLVLASFVLVACATAPEPRYCSNGNVTIDARHDGGNLGRCRFVADDVVELTIEPEDREVVIEQPWFSFRATARNDESLTVRLRFPDAYARFWPKLSDDGDTWTRAAQQAVSVSGDRKRMDLRVDSAANGAWVSAQELLTQPWYDGWLDELAEHPELVVETIGTSHAGRPIELVNSRRNHSEFVVLLGRQHPAEVPGAIAMREFVAVVLAESELARRFRERFGLFMIPLVNPDGVANGHWRHNLGQTDLNRDWGPFTQPETRAVVNVIDRLEAAGIRPTLMLDFHATRFTGTAMYYTQTDEDVTDPAGFAVNWLGAVRQRLPDYDFEHAPRPTSAQQNTKGYFFTRFGIPSITYEIGDEADRDELRAVTPVFAEEMMRTLLTSP